MKKTLFTPRIAGALMVLTGAFLISFSAVFVKWAHVSPTMSGFYRNLFGGILLMAVVCIRNERRWLGARYFLLTLVCGLLFGLDLFVWHRSIQFVGPGLATILANFQVFFTALMGALLLGERVSARLLLAMPMAVFGLILLAGIRWNQLAPDYHVGIFFGLAAALCYALYLLTLRRLQTPSKKLSPLVVLASVSGVAACALGLTARLQGDSFVIPDPQSWAALLAYGFFSQVLGWVLITRGLPRLKTALAGLLLLLQPTLAFTWDILFFGRPLTGLNALGALVALGAIYLGITAKQKTSA